MANKFLTKYFSLSKAAKLRGDLTTFTQLESESIYEAWERYKELIRKVSHHGLPAWLEIQFFYNRLNPNTKMIIDAAAGGALMGKEWDEAYELLEEMASNSYQWQSDGAVPRKAAGVHEIDAISAIHAQLTLLIKKFDTTNVSTIQTQNPPYDEFAVGQPANGRQIGNFGFTSNEQAN